MNRPSALNAFDSGLHNDMVEAMAWYERENDIWCCVLTGTGRAFSAGNDLVELSKIGRDEQQRRKKGLVEVGFGGLANRRGLNKPIIAAVNGVAMGGGLSGRMELAIACDVIIASENAKFALPETRVGLSPGAGGAANLHRLIGYHNAMYLIMTAKHISAQEAKWYGLVQEVVPHDKLLSSAISFAETIVGNSPDGVRASKAQARNGREVGWVRANIEAEKLPESIAMMRGENAKEGPKAFAQKRPKSVSVDTDDLEAYLADDFDPSTATVQSLKSILTKNQVTIPSTAQKKDVYVQLFNEHITPKRTQLRRAAVTPVAKVMPPNFTDASRPAQEKPVVRGTALQEGSADGGQRAQVRRRETSNFSSENPFQSPERPTDDNSSSGIHRRRTIATSSAVPTSSAPEKSPERGRRNNRSAVPAPPVEQDPSVPIAPPRQPRPRTPARARSKSVKRRETTGGAISGGAPTLANYDEPLAVPLQSTIPVVPVVVPVGGPLPWTRKTKTVAAVTQPASRAQAIPPSKVSEPLEVNRVPATSSIQNTPFPLNDILYFTIGFFLVSAAIAFIPHYSIVILRGYASTQPNLPLSPAPVEVPGSFWQSAGWNPLSHVLPWQLKCPDHALCAGGKIVGCDKGYHTAWSLIPGPIAKYLPFPLNQPSCVFDIRAQLEAAEREVAVRGMARKLIEVVRETVGRWECGEIPVDAVVEVEVDRWDSVGRKISVRKEKSKGVSLRAARTELRERVVTGGRRAPKDPEFNDLWNQVVDRVVSGEREHSDDGLGLGTGNKEKSTSGLEANPFANITLHTSHSDHFFTTDLPPIRSWTCTIRRAVGLYLAPAFLLVTSVIAGGTYAFRERARRARFARVAGDTAQRVLAFLRRAGEAVSRDQLRDEVVAVHVDPDELVEVGPNGSRSMRAFPLGLRSGQVYAGPTERDRIEFWASVAKLVTSNSNVREENVMVEGESHEGWRWTGLRGGWSG
ncbi:hypothetical protein HDU93_006604 [Gonapodya sp. JEL0774]|nr:hypothetical protein HDU93_006604 [Gonapodya sp. JEL0774]